MSVQVRDLTRVDLPGVGEMLFLAFRDNALQHGFSPGMRSVDEGIAWAWTILRHGEGHFLVAELDGRVAGLCCLNTRGDQGSIGPVAVDPRLQGHGIGRALVHETLTRAEGLKSVRLFQEAYNASSFSLYYSFGFIPVADLLDLWLVGTRAARVGSPGNIIQCGLADIPVLSAYNHPRSGFNRDGDLRYFVRWGRVFADRQGPLLKGFLACLPAARSVQLGPLLAEGEPEAIALFQHAVQAFAGRTCQTRIMARDHALATKLHELGFRLHCLDVLMVRGTWRPDRYVEAFGRFPESA